MAGGCACAATTFAIPTKTAAQTQTTATPAALVRDQLAKPESELDFLTAKIAFDQFVDPTIDAVAVTAEIDDMAATALMIAGPDADDTRRLASVRTLIYLEGWWNENRAFSYHLDDPLGETLRNKLLSTYLSTRLGNCVSMPILFLILADRLGVNIVLSTAPLHLFLKYIDNAGGTVNLEATSGAIPTRDVWIRQNMLMTDEAVANGVYLRTLTRKQSVAVMAAMVLEHLLYQRRWQEVIDVAGPILEVYPQEALTIVKRGTAYGGLLEDEFYRLYPDPSQIPPNLLPRYHMLAEANADAFATAELLGWRETDGNMPTPDASANS